MRAGSGQIVAEQSVARICLRLAVLGFICVAGIRAGVANAAEEGWTIQRTVIDAEEKPVAGVKVLCVDYGWPEDRKELVTNERGEFLVKFPKRTRVVKVHAREEGTGRWGFEDIPTSGKVKVRPIKLFPTREMVVEVVDGAGKPVEGATVEIIQVSSTVLSAKTGKEGVAKGRVAEETSALIRAMKGKVGFDYFVYFPSARKGEKAVSITSPVKLTLDGAKTVEVAAIDHVDRPLPGVGIQLAMVQRSGRETQGDLPRDELTRVTTDEDGMATFDWIPHDQAGHFQVICRSPEFETDLFQSIDVRTGQKQFLLRLWRKTKLSGRVEMADGTPVEGAKILLQGKGPVSMTEEYKTLTDADGRWELEVRGEQLYTVVAEKGGLVGHQVGVIAHEQQPVMNVTIRLQEGVVVTGKVLEGDVNRPVARQTVTMSLEVGPIPEELREPPSLPMRYNALAYFSRRMTTDANGVYKFVVSPGKYLMSVAYPEKDVELMISEGQKEIVEDLHISTGTRSRKAR